MPDVQTLSALGTLVTALVTLLLVLKTFRKVDIVHQEIKNGNNANHKE